MTRKRSSRPMFLNPVSIGLPVGAITSFAHRVSGVLMVAGCVAAIYLLDRSLQSEVEFSRVVALFDRVIVKGFAIVFVWALAHHLAAGVRHMLMDIDVGASLPRARRSAWAVNLGALAVALLAAMTMVAA